MQNKLDKDFFKLYFNLPPEEAIKFLEKKDLKVSIDWFDVYREEHVRAFTVAGITKLDVLEDVRNALVEAQKNGETLESFKQNIIPKLRQKGWYGNRLVTRKDGSEKEVKISSPWRLKTIYRTNMAVAAMTGLYKELKAASDIMPYWRYVTVGDGRVREEHAKIHGKILRHDDPFWDKYFPPNGYNCRCSVEGITEIEFKKKGYKLSDGKSMANLVMPFVKTGWDYNPGKEYYTPDPKDYPEEFKPIAEKITKEAEKALDEIKKPVEPVKASDTVNESFIAKDNTEKGNILTQPKVSEKQIVAKQADESKAVITMEEERAVKEYVSSWSYKINDKLRKHLKTSPADNQMINNLDSLLSKMPRYNGTVTRTLNFLSKKALKEYLEKREVGKIVPEESYFSTTCGEIYDENADVLLYIINSSKGADIRVYNESEQEILYSRNSKFLVKSKKYENGCWLIELEEV